MSNEVRRFYAREVIRLEGDIVDGGVKEAVLASDYAALEAECERLRQDIKNAFNDDLKMRTLRQQEQEIIDLRAELEAARKQEPVGHQYQNREGEWCNFMDQRHYENTLEDGAWPIRAIFTLPPLAGQVSVPDVCDGHEQEAFEAFAKREGMDTSMHPLHWLFLNRETYAARQGWKAAIRYCRALLATPSMEV